MVHLKPVQLWSSVPLVACLKCLQSSRQHCHCRRRSMKSKASTGNADLDNLSSAVDDILQGHVLGAGHSMCSLLPALCG